MGEGGGAECSSDVFCISRTRLECALYKQLLCPQDYSRQSSCRVTSPVTRLSAVGLYRMVGFVLSGTYLNPDVVECVVLHLSGLPMLGGGGRHTPGPTD